MKSVSLFPTCLVDISAPDVGVASVKALEGRGFEVSVPDDATCCGQPAWNAGQARAAYKVAAQTLAALAETTGPIVIPSGSCATMIRVFWQELFELEGNRADQIVARSVIDRVFELSEFLHEQGIPTSDPTDTQPTVYHQSCHMLRELNITSQPEDLLGTVVSGVRTSEARGRCCGFGGLFSVKLPEVSTAMADEVLDAAVAAGAERIVGCDTSCLMHLEARSRRRGLGLAFGHLAEILAGEASS